MLIQNTNPLLFNTSSCFRPKKPKLLKGQLNGKEISPQEKEGEEPRLETVLASQIFTEINEGQLTLLEQTGHELRRSASSQEAKRQADQFIQNYNFPAYTDLNFDANNDTIILNFDPEAIRRARPGAICSVDETYFDLLFVERAEVRLMNGEATLVVAYRGVDFEGWGKPGFEERWEEAVIIKPSLKTSPLAVNSIEQFLLLASEILDPKEPIFALVSTIDDELDSDDGFNHETYWVLVTGSHSITLRKGSPNLEIEELNPYDKAYVDYHMQHRTTPTEDLREISALINELESQAIIAKETLLVMRLGSDYIVTLDQKFIPVKVTRHSENDSYALEFNCSKIFPITLAPSESDYAEAEFILSDPRIKELADTDKYGWELIRAEDSWLFINDQQVVEVQLTYDSEKKPIDLRLDLILG